MIKQLTLYVAISVVVSLGIGYGTGHYVASNKAERDVAAIRAILEGQEAQKKRDVEAAEKARQEYVREKKEIEQMRLKRLEKYKQK